MVTSILSITVGVMTLIVVIAIMNGLESDVKSRIMSFKPHIVITEHNGNTMSKHEFIIKQLNTIPGINQASAFISTQAIVSTEKASIGTIIKGLQSYEGYESKKGKSTLSLLKHTLQDKVPKIIIGNDLIEPLGLSIGNIVYVRSSRGSISPMGHVPCIKKFQVAGFIESNSDLPNLYISLKEAQKLLRIGNRVTGIEIKTSDGTSIDEISKIISLQIGNSINIKTWKEMNINLFSAMKLEKIAMFIIFSLVVLIATFSITASLAMSVYDKKQEISILKTMGATKKDISQIFVVKGMILGSIGTVSGALTGILVSVIINRYPIIGVPLGGNLITTLPVHLKACDILLVMLSSLFMSFIASIYPAKKASYTNPIEVANTR
jgi:lipoprotein-releasing system permease protein